MALKLVPVVDKVMQLEMLLTIKVFGPTKAPPIKIPQPTPTPIDTIDVEFELDIVNDEFDNTPKKIAVAQNGAAN